MLELMDGRYNMMYIASSVTVHCSYFLYYSFLGKD